MRSPIMQIKIYTNSNELPPLLPGNIQHSAIMFRALEGSRHSKPYMFVAYENEKELAHLIIIEKRNTLLDIPLPGKHYKIYGEGCYREDCRNREEIYSEFIDEFFKIIDATHSYTEIKTIEDPRFAYSTLRRREFIPVRDHRIYISLHSKAPEERLSKRYRSHIRKAAKRDVSYRTATSKEEIDKALHLL